MKKYFLFSPLLLLLLASCSTALYQPVSDGNNAHLDDLKKGRALYVNTCAGCHQLYLPNKFSAKEWKTNLDEMQSRAKITDADKELIYQYLIGTPQG